jgi:phospholipid/cholesterol/gamma-HCH transport system substrate-binding protein
MDVKSTGKVGLMVIIALVLLFALWSYLAHVRPNSYKVTVTFDDVRGLSKQSTVRMAGFSIGEVSSIELDTRVMPPRPVVTLAIDNQYNIPKDADFVIESGLLITTPQIEVHPKPSDTTTAIRAADILPKDGTARIQGAKAPGALAGISPELADTVKNLNSTFTGLNSKINRLTDKLERVVDDTDKLVNTSTRTVNDLRGVVGNPKLKQSLTETVTNFRDVSRDASSASKELSHQLRDFISSGKGKFNKLADTAISLSTKLGNTIDDAREVVKKLTEQVSDPRLQQSLQETVELVRSTMASVRQITSDLHQITGDPNLPKNISETVTHLNHASEKGEDALDKLDSILGKFTKATNKVGKTSFPKVDVLANVYEDVDPSHLKVDLDARLALGRRSLLDIGLFDLGQDTRLNLQYGSRYGDNLLLRYGIYASRFGAGIEYQPVKNFGLRADLYDTNLLRLDVRGLFRVNNNASFWVGEEGIFRSPTPAIGIQLKP